MEEEGEKKRTRGKEMGKRLYQKTEKEKQIRSKSPPLSHGASLPGKGVPRPEQISFPPSSSLLFSFFSPFLRGGGEEKERSRGE